MGCYTCYRGNLHGPWPGDAYLGMCLPSPHSLLASTFSTLVCLSFALSKHFATSFSFLIFYQVGPEEEGTAHYCLTSTVMLSLTTDDESSGTFSLSGSIRRQVLNLILQLSEQIFTN